MNNDNSRIRAFQKIEKNCTRWDRVHCTVKRRFYNEVCVCTAWCQAELRCVFFLVVPRPHFKRGCFVCCFEVLKKKSTLADLKSIHLTLSQNIYLQSIRFLSLFDVWSVLFFLLFLSFLDDCTCILQIAKRIYEQLQTRDIGVRDKQCSWTFCPISSRDSKAWPIASWRPCRSQSKTLSFRYDVDFHLELQRKKFKIIKKMKIFISSFFMSSSHAKCLKKCVQNGNSVQNGNYYNVYFFY